MGATALLGEAPPGSVCIRAPTAHAGDTLSADCTPGRMRRWERARGLERAWGTGTRLGQGGPGRHWGERRPPNWAGKGVRVGLASRGEAVAAGAAWSAGVKAECGVSQELSQGCLWRGRSSASPQTRWYSPP